MLMYSILRPLQRPRRFIIPFVIFLFHRKLKFFDSVRYSHNAPFSTDIKKAHSR